MPIQHAGHDISMRSRVRLGSATKIGFNNHHSAPSPCISPAIHDRRAAPANLWSLSHKV